MRQTAGFPLPFSARTNAGPLFADIDWTAFGINLLCLVFLGVILLQVFPNIANRVTSKRVALVLLGYAALNFIFGWVVFIPLLIPAIALNEVMPISLKNYMDVGSRLLLLGVVAAAARSRRSGLG